MDTTVRPMSEQDRSAVIDLWHRAGTSRPWNDPNGDIDFALASTNAEILVAEQGGAVVGSVMVGHDGHRGTAYYVGVDPECRRQGIGTAVMEAAQAWLRERGVWKMNLLIRADNDAAVRFYEALGFDEQPRAYVEKWLDPKRRPDKPS